MWYNIKPWCTIISKHKILLSLVIFKFIYFMLIISILMWIVSYYKDWIDENIKLYYIFPVIYSLFVYAFFKLALWFVEFYNSLFIISWDSIYIISATLLLKDEIEVIDALKIIEIDSHARWIFQNILWFWTIRIELQTKEERNIWFIPNPYKLLNTLKVQRETILENRKKKYIVWIEK